MALGAAGLEDEDALARMNSTVETLARSARGRSRSVETSDKLINLAVKVQDGEARVGRFAFVSLARYRTADRVYKARLLVAGPRGCQSSHRPAHRRSRHDFRR